MKPDTRPGIGPEHSVAAYGTIADVKAEVGWHYRVKSVHDGRNGPRVPEERYSSHCTLPTSSDMLPAIKFSPYIYLFNFLFVNLFVC